MHKVLFLSLPYMNGPNGGKIISCRNLDLLKDYFGADRVLQAEALGLTFRLRNPLYAPKVKKIIREKGIDTVFIDNSKIGPFPAGFYKQVKTVCFFHNLEGLYVRAENRGLAGLLKSILIRRNERQNLYHSALTLSINARDSRLAEKVYGRPADHILPSALRDRTDNDTLLKQNPDRKNLLFVGSDFYGNTEGLFRFIESCMPEIHGRLRVVGLGMEKYRGRYGPEFKTDFVGYAEDLNEEYYNSAAVVLPISSGYGMKTKTCEALMFEKKIFGTPEAFSGFECQDSPGAVICADPGDFVREINAFIRSGEAVFSRENRDLYLNKYSYEAGRALFEGYMREADTER